MSIETSKLNVINREYETIFRDLVNAIPSLTDQWATNDESDPGIVLVKLMSMVGDMLSYNTDKAYLEAFPDSVTQRKNAYQIYKLIGYKMKWYRSAKAFCYFNNIGNTSAVYIPRYTMFSSKDGTINYCNPNEDLYIRYGVDGKKDSRQQTTLIEGIPVTPSLYVDATSTSFGDKYLFNNSEKWHNAYKYNVNKEKIVENRLYFNDFNVDQDHITLIDDQDEEWTMVENINTADNLNSKIFEFSIDEFDRPYLRLIDFWEDLNINNFKLFYVKSSGKNGKVASSVLQAVSSNVYSLINSKNNPKLEIVNMSSEGGYNPETPYDAKISSANYINTFDTLVTLDDFTKFVKRYEYTGNAISKDLTNDFYRFNVNSYDTIEELVNQIVDSFNIPTSGTETLENFSTFSLLYSVNTDTNEVVRNYSNINNIWSIFDTDEKMNLLNGIGNIFDISFPISTTATQALHENGTLDLICDLYELIYIYNYLYDTTNTQNINTYKILAEAIIKNYYKLPMQNNIYEYNNRNPIDDLNYILSVNKNKELNNRSVNIYITPNNNYSNENFSDYQNDIDNDIYNSKIISLDVNTTTQGIDYYKWEVSGIIYLKSPVTYTKAQGILVAINNNLKQLYTPNRINYCEPIKPVTLSDQILNVDKLIHYIDIDKITYTKYDPVTRLNIGAPFTDKSLISGIKYIQNLPFTLNTTVDTENIIFNTDENGNYDFEIDLYNGYYYDSNGDKHFYLEEYTEQEKKQGYILIKPGTFCVSLENGTYIIKDNGYGTLVCNEDILESSSIQYKVTENYNETTQENENSILVKFKINSGISLTTPGTLNIKFTRNKINMIKYAGLDPNKFIIDNESIEV